jgi:hypothetical protein
MKSIVWQQSQAQQKITQVVCFSILLKELDWFKNEKECLITQKMFNLLM